MFFSPSSVMLCLAMVHEAASGKTRQDMAKALEIAGLNPVDTARAVADLKAPFRHREHVEVTGANSLWCGEGMYVRPEYAARLRDIYDAELAMLDFGAGNAVSRINAWVNQKTKGKISHIVSVLPPLATLVAVNAIYFKGRWTRTFERRSTHDGLFTTATGHKRQLPMMHQSGRYSYYEDRKLQAVVLPYEGGVAMHVILPAAHTDVQQFQQSLSWSGWNSQLARFEEAAGTIQIPRFKLDCHAQLERALKALGMERAFDPGRAEFDGVKAEHLPVYIDQILHRAVAEMNEEGTEASAATAIAVPCSSPRFDRAPRPFRMIVDRSFFVVIRDETTRSILFMGWIRDPEAGAL
ncbi:MAG TPA: serpin family protein [Terriglobales bacterium]|nr:serpin family protein [Terriglobales bacterium]